MASSNSSNSSPVSSKKHTLEQWVSLLKTSDVNQPHILSLLNASGHEHDKKKLISHLNIIETTYPGGLSAYVKRSKLLLDKTIKKIDFFSDYKVSVPEGVKLNVASKEFQDFETIGFEELQFCCFVLVAGGLGERLGYPDVKINLPVEISTESTYIEYYISFILEIQKHLKNNNNKNVILPLAIMTSDDTHARTVKLLQDNKYFGLKEDQIILIKQNKVPALSNVDGLLETNSNDPYALEWKPHGHGDVHTLLLQHGLARQWCDEGRKWMFIFQDTNSLALQCLPTLLGVSARNDLVMNSLAIPRKPGEAIGALCKLTNQTDNTNLTINVEYNQLEGLLRRDSNTDAVDADGYSLYPGNANVLVFKLSRYADVLNKSKGSLPEFINPKFKEGTTEFVQPTRLECMMQDFPKLLDSTDKVGFTQLDRWFCFSTVKNNIKTAANKSREGLPPECGFSGEADHYYSAHRLLQLACEEKNCTVDIAKQESNTFSDVTHKLGPRIIIKPSFAMCYKQVKDHIQPNSRIRIANNSTIILDGDITLDGLDVEGCLILRAKPGSSIQVKDLKVRNKGWELQPIDQGNASNLPIKFQIRGYHLVKHQQSAYVSTSGVKVVDSTCENNV